MNEELSVRRSLSDRADINNERCREHYFDSQTFIILTEDKFNRQTVKTSLTSWLSERFPRLSHANRCEVLITRNVWTPLINLSDSQLSKCWDKLAGICVRKQLAAQSRIVYNKIFRNHRHLASEKKKGFHLANFCQTKAEMTYKTFRPSWLENRWNNWNKISLFARQNQPAAWRRRSIVDFNWVCNQQKFDYDSIFQF